MQRETNPADDGVKRDVADSNSTFHKAGDRHLPVVTIELFELDFHTLADDVAQRVACELGQNAGGCVFVNPLATIRARRRCTLFFEAVKQYQAQWCRQSSSCFPRWARRRSSAWISGGEWIRNKFGRYLDRAMCFTGILFIDGQLVLPHKYFKTVSETKTEIRCTRQ